MAELISARLTAFLHQESRRAFSWAERPCVSLPAAWLETLGYPDVTQGWRGQWSDEASAMALLDRVGGVAALMAAAAETLSLKPSHGVRAGDVGAVRLLDGRVVGAVCTGHGWAARSPRGLWRGQARVVAGWRVEA